VRSTFNTSSPVIPPCGRLALPLQSLSTRRPSRCRRLLCAAGTIGFLSRLVACAPQSYDQAIGGNLVAATFTSCCIWRYFGDGTSLIMTTETTVGRTTSEGSLRRERGSGALPGQEDQKKGEEELEERREERKGRGCSPLRSRTRYSIHRRKPRKKGKRPRGKWKVRVSALSIQLSTTKMREKEKN